MSLDLTGDYIMMNAIDASITTSWPGGFAPVGDNFDEFFGTFNGQNHTITGLFIDRDATSYVGLFGDLGIGSHVSNLHLIDCNITGYNFVGSIVGKARSTIANCSTTGDTYGHWWVGGLAGDITNEGIITDCHSDANANGNWDVGSFAGSNGGTVSNCHSTGNANGDWDVGGFVGWNLNHITNCYSTGLAAGTNNYCGGFVGLNDGTISNCYSTGNADGDIATGGFVGMNNEGTSITNSYCTGNVNAALGSAVGGFIGLNHGSITVCYAEGYTYGGSLYVGGFVGSNNDTIDNCYSRGDADSIDGCVGGFAGQNMAASTITNCYSTGGASGLSFIGGFNGYNQGVITDCFWDTETSGLPSSDGGTPKTTAEMKSQATFDPPWDFASIWGIQESLTYPYLRANRPALTPHSPIRINSNADFGIGINGVSAGDGSPGTPWIIEGWEINGTGYGYCIYVGNTSDYFIVRDCYLHNASGLNIFPYFYQNGVTLWGVANSKIANCNISSNNRHGISLFDVLPISPPLDNNIFDSNTLFSNTETGIWLYEPINSKITNNTVMFNNYGISISGSINNIIANNTVHSNNLYGIFISSRSNNNTVDNNTANSNDKYGIYLLSTTNNTVTNNKMANDGLVIGGDYLMSWNTHKVDTSNTVNGKPVVYWKNQTGGVIPPGAGQVILANCTDIVVENQNVSNGSVGVLIGFSNNITIANNSADSNDFGVRLYITSNMNINNNTANSNTDNGMTFFSIDNSTVTNNTCNSNIDYGIYLHSSSMDNILDNNTVNFNDRYGILVSGSDRNNVTNNNANMNIQVGIYISSSDNISITGNTLNSNDRDGFATMNSYYNTFAHNTVESNVRYGVYLTSSYDNLIYHNNIINNSVQARDWGDNFWDNGYPSGGNYWSDYSGVDVKSGPAQDLPGSDGIGDTNYTDIEGNGRNVDNYPLLSPYDHNEYLIPLNEGWNLISLPTRQLNWSIDSVLESITGKWDCIQTFNSTDSSWETNNIHRPATLNDLDEMNHFGGYWINITQPGVTLTVKGDLFNSTLSIPLRAGWNLVGYPSLATNKTIADALSTTGYDAVEGFNASAPYRISPLADTYLMQPGEGYWVHVPADTIWVVDW